MGAHQRHVNLPLQSIVNGTAGMSVNVLYRVAMVHDTTPEQRECTKRTEEKNVLDQHQLKKVAMFKNAQLTVYGVIGSMMSAQLNVVVEPSQWLESRPKRPCLEAKNVKERPMLNKHATSNLAQLIVLG